VIYSFSVFASPLRAAHGWSMAEVMLAFTINGAVAPIPMILGGFIVDRGGARISIPPRGPAVHSRDSSWPVSQTPSPSCTLTYGLIAGLGQGLAYSGCLSNTLKLFPDKRGAAAGLITGGMGAGTVIGRPDGSMADRRSRACGPRSCRWVSPTR